MAQTTSGAKLKYGAKHKFIIGAIPLVFCLLLAALTYRAYRQQRVNHDLITAVKRDNVSATRMALQHGADPNTRDNTPPANVWQTLRSLFVRRLDTDAQGATALNVAAQHLAIVDDDLVKRQAAIAAIVPLLLQAGADPNIADNTGEYPLMAAIMWASPVMVQCLLDHKANVNAQGFAGSTVLMMAASRNEENSDKVKLLLAHGANVNARMDNGTTALIYAAGTGEVNNLRLLLQHHADVRAKDKQGLTALQWAQRNQQMDAVRLLQREETAKRAK